MKTLLTFAAFLLATFVSIAQYNNGQQTVLSQQNYQMLQQSVQALQQYQYQQQQQPQQRPVSYTYQGQNGNTHYMGQSTVSPQVAAQNAGLAAMQAREHISRQNVVIRNAYGTGSAQSYSNPQAGYQGQYQNGTDQYQAQSYVSNQMQAQLAALANQQAYQAALNGVPAGNVVYVHNQYGQASAVVPVLYYPRP